MRTTVDIEEKLLKNVVALTGEKSKNKALNKALEEYVRRSRVEELRAMLGKVDLVDNWRELEELEIKEMDETYRAMQQPEAAETGSRRGDPEDVEAL